MTSNLFQQRADELQNPQELEENPLQPQQVQPKQENFFEKRSSELKKLEELQNEDLDPQIERHLARLTSRGIEQVAGAPGNIRNLAYSVKDLYQKEGLLPKSLTKHLPEFPKENESFKEFEKAIPIAKTVSDLIGWLPTSTELKKKASEKTKGYTDPQSETERIGDEAFESLVSSALPGQGQRNVWKNFAAPIAGVLGKEAVKYIGGGDKSQALTQIGLNLAVPMMGANAPEMSRNLWRNLRQTVPNVNVNTQGLLNRAYNLRQRIERGLGARSETQATTTLNRLIEKLERGQISAEELMASNISLNEIVGDPELFGRGGSLFAEVRGIIQDGMREVGHQAPEWYQAWQQANEVHGAIANSNHVANVIRRHSEPLVSEGARALFHAAAHGTAKAAGALPPLYAIYKGTQVFQRMANSPVLMQYYTHVFLDALRGNTASMAKNLDKLDQGLLKEENKSSKTSSPKKSQKS